MQTKTQDSASILFKLDAQSPRTQCHRIIQRPHDVAQKPKDLGLLLIRADPADVEDIATAALVELPGIAQEVANSFIYNFMNGFTPKDLDEGSGRVHRVIIGFMRAEVDNDTARAYPGQVVPLHTILALATMQGVPLSLMPSELSGRFSEQLVSYFGLTVATDTTRRAKFAASVAACLVEIGRIRTLSLRPSPLRWQVSMELGMKARNLFNDPNLFDHMLGGVIHSLKSVTFAGGVS